MADDLRQPVSADPFQSEPACAAAIELASQVGREPKPVPAAARVEISGESSLGEIGPYKLLKMLGQGGMGAVYKALHPRLDKIVALKVLTTGRLKSGDAINRFQREMKAVGKLDHPHLIRALDAGEADGAHYLVMEFVAGTDLDGLIKQHGPLPIAEACELVIQAASGLQAAHSRGMVHRDIKPANLMLAQQEFGPPVVKVLDLGLALLADADPVEVGGLTSDGQIMGTIDYMAPEQANDSHSVDIRADIYSLGATLYALLTGGSLFQGKPNLSLMQKLTSLATEPAPPIRERRADISKALAAVVHRMLAKKPQDRFATPADVIAALKPFAAGANLASLGSGAGSPTSDGSTSVDSYGGTVMLVSAQNIESTIQMPSSKSSNSQSPGRPWKAIAGAAIAAVVLFAVILLTLKTPHGEVIVEIPADLSAEARKDIKINVTGDGAAEVASEANGWKIGIKEGRYKVELTGGGDQVQIDDQQVTVNRNKKAIVTITMKPTRAMAANVTKPAGGANSDPDRRAVEWLLSVPNGDSNLIVEIVGGQMTGLANSQLPAVPFHVHTMTLGGPIIDQWGDRLADELATKIGGIRVRGAWISSRTLTTAGFVKLVAMPEFSEVSDINLKCFDRDMDDGVFPLLAKLSDLKTVTIVAQPHLTGAGIGELKACSKLGVIDWLSESGDSPSSTALEELTQLPKLYSLSFNSITCTERHMMAIAKLKLRQLGFYQSKVDDDMLRHLTTMEKLETLGIANNPITDQGLSELKQIKALKTLDLRGTKVTAAGVADLQQALPNCKIEWDYPDPDRKLAEWLRSYDPELTFGGNFSNNTPFTVEPGQPIPNEPFTMNYINLVGKKVDEQGDAYLEELASHIQGVRLKGLMLATHSMTSRGMAKFLHHPELADCTTIAMNGQNMEDDVLAAISKLTKLTGVVFQTGPKLTGQGIGLLRELKELTGLTLLHTPGLSAEALEQLQTLPKLDTLNIDGFRFTEQHLAAITKFKLKQLLTHEAGIDDAMVARFAEMQTIEKLGFSNSPITDAALPELKQLKGLVILYLFGTKVTAAGVADLQQALPNCKIEWDAPKE